ncbi:hypothetical protein C8R45DRAFT_1219175 [Mycena sanguinolenta]|nr:hypothetical protein C8R45DRAFT_1219175 [Mycena sanguinolenta]
MESNQFLRNRLTEIDAQIALLKAERNIVQKKLRSIKYPVLKLPFEVTSEIFVQCLPDPEDADPIFDFSLEELPVPVLLTQVCRTWRAIAFKTPRIWAVFRVDIETWPEDFSRGTLRLTEWLERAGISPLSFIVRQEPGSTQIAPLRKLLSPILARSRQWRTIDLALPHADLVSKKFQSAVRGNLPLLETLQIASVTTLGPNANPVMTAFELAPRLRRVALKNLRPTGILLPWQHLSHLSAESLNGIDCLHVLRSAVSLVECRFGSVHGSGIVTGTAPLLSRPALKVLHLEGGSVCRLILGLLTLPSLVELRYGDGNSSEHVHFIDFLSRSRPPLLRLHLHGGKHSRIVHGSPFLIDLISLEMSGSTIGGISYFSRDLLVRDPASFLPKLQSLVLRGDYRFGDLNYGGGSGRCPRVQMQSRIFPDNMGH